MAKHTFRNRRGELVEIPEIAATLLSFDEFQSLNSTRSEEFGALSSQFESLLQRMQTPAAKKGMASAFNATPAALGKAAVEAK
jgi:antitoxin Phd